MSISLNIIGQRIAAKRKKMTITQVQLADQVGISDKTLGKIENGFDMKLSVLFAIADVLKIDAIELMRSDDSADTLSSLNQPLSNKNKQQICDHLKAISQLLPE